MREGLTKEKRFLSYFRTFIILVLALCISMTVLQSVCTDFLLRQETRSKGYNTFALLMHSHDVLFNQLDEVFRSLCDNQQYLEFPNYYKRNEVNKQILIRDQLDATISSVKALKNICLYYPQSDMTFSTDQTISVLGLYHDSDFLRMLKQSGGAFSKTYVRQVYYAAENKPTKVVSMVRTLPVYATNRQVTAYLIVDLDFSVLSQAFEKIVADNDSSMMVYDENDALISVIGRFYTLADLFPQGRRKSNGITFCEGQWNGESLYVYSSTIDDPNWSYVFVQNNSHTSQKLREIQTIILLTCATIMLFALVYAWYASKRLYKPIRRVSAQLGDTGVDVFNHIEHMIEENERLKLTLQDNIITGRNHQLLHQALTGLNISTAGNELCQMIPEQYECILVLIKTATDCDALAQNCLTEALKAYGMRFVVKLYTASNEVAFVVASAKFSLADIHASAEDILSTIREEDASIGVSRPFSDMKEIAQAYQQAKEALGMYLVRGAGNCYCFLEIRNKLAPDYPYQMENAILRAFRNANKEELTRHIKAFESYLVERDCLPQHVRDFYTQLFCSCQRLMMDRADCSLEPFTYSHREMLTLDSIGEMSDYIIGMLIRLLEQMSISKKEEKSELIENVCAYIDRHLGELETVDKLAAKFYISITTLRSQFSRIMGTSLKAYIDQRRVFTAKQMLADTDLRVQEIASQMGFQYPQSFISFFKNAAGMTPGEYREQHKSPNGAAPKDAGE